MPTTGQPKVRSVDRVYHIDQHNGTINCKCREVSIYIAKSNDGILSDTETLGDNIYFGCE
jgi:hypothetical protein